jgi:MFS transporter, ACS family, tartrate transporter
VRTTLVHARMPIAQAWQAAVTRHLAQAHIAVWLSPLRPRMAASPVPRISSLVVFAASRTATRVRFVPIGVRASIQRYFKGLFVSLMRVTEDTMDNQIRKKVTAKILPLLCACFFISILDRTNVGFAALRMNADIGLSPAAYGFGAGIFFLGYFIFEVPSNILLERVGARRWIARIMVSWGVISMGMALVHRPYEFYAARFLLGFAEAGFVPGVLYYLNQWYTKREVGAVAAIFFACGPIANAVGSPLSSLLIEHFSWRWMFVIEGIPAVLLGLVVLLRLPDRVQDARFLTDVQRRTLLAALHRDRSGDAAHGSALTAFRDGPTLIFGLQYFLILTTSYAVIMWLPQIIGQLRISEARVGWLVAVPFIVGAVSIYGWGLYTRFWDDRAFYTLIPCLVGAAGFLFGASSTSSLATVMSFCCVAGGVYAAQSAYWGQPRAAVSGSAAAAALALSNSLGNLGGFSGPYLFGVLRQQTGSFNAPLILSAFLLCAAGLLSFVNGRLASRSTLTQDLKAEREPPVIQ